MEMNSDELVAGADSITAASQTDDGLYSDDDHLAVFEGEIETVDEPVRIIAVTTETGSDGSLADSVTECVREWNNVSTHPNVLRVHDWGTDPVPWVATAAPEGVTLREGRSALSPGEICSVASATAEALRNAGLYNTRHGNLTPESIWVDPADGSVVVDDWGLERLVHEFGDGEFVTPYTAPEQVADDAVVDERTDVYALGAVTYESLTEREVAPLEANSGPTSSTAGDIAPPSTIDDSLPVSLDAPLLRALSHEPDERHQSVYEFKTELDAVAPEPAPADESGTRSPDSREESAETSTGQTTVEEAVGTAETDTVTESDETAASDTQSIEAGASLADIESQVDAMETQHARRLAWLKFALLPLFVLSAVPLIAFLWLVYQQMLGPAPDLLLYLTVYTAAPLIGTLTLYSVSRIIPKRTITAEHVQRPVEESEILDLFRGDMVTEWRARWFADDGRVAGTIGRLLIANEVTDDIESIRTHIERAIVATGLSAVGLALVGIAGGWFVFEIFLGGQVSLLRVTVNRVPDLILALKIPLLILLCGIVFGLVGSVLGFGVYLLTLEMSASSVDHRIGTGNWTRKTKLVGGDDWTWREVVRYLHRYCRDHPGATLYVFGPAAVFCVLLAFLWGSAPMSLGEMIENPVSGTFFWFYVPVFITAVPLVVFGAWNRWFRQSVSDDVTETVATAVTDCGDDPSIDEILAVCCEESTGTAGTEFQRLRDRVEDDIDPGAAFAALAGRYRTTSLRLLGVSIREAPDPVEGLTAGVEHAEKGQDIETAWLRQRPILAGIPLVIFVLLVVVLVLFKTEYLDIMAQMANQASESRAGGSAAARAGQFDSNVDTGLLSMLTFHLLSIQSVFLGLYAGYTGTRTFSSGYKYVVGTLLLALVTWVAIG